MYQPYIKSPDTALCHLFLHCCFKDGEFTEAEIDEVAEKFTKLDMQKSLNFKDELREYRSYRETIITSEQAYLQHLVKLINATNEFALYSYCAELSLSDAALEFTEKKFLENLGSLLEIDEAEQSIIQKLMVQRKVVETQKFF